jgi:hypothetical protein
MPTIELVKGEKLAALFNDFERRNTENGVSVF